MSERLRPDNIRLDDALEDALAGLRARNGNNLLAVIFFGSRLLNTSPNRHSAADWFIVVRDYREFYQRQRDLINYPVAVVACLNRILAPNIIHIPLASGAGIKAIVISHADLEKALSGSARDHFCKGRLMQTVAIIDALDTETAGAIEQGLARARFETLAWVPLFCTESFSLHDYCAAMMRQSYAAEIRPEAGGRVDEVIANQEQSLAIAFSPVLTEGIRSGLLIRSGDRYRLLKPPSRSQRRRWRWYFRCSRVRATLRWGKYVMTFANWPDYVARKLERRSGIKVEITDRERRWPLLLLWPKVISTLIRLRRL